MAKCKCAAAILGVGQCLRLLTWYVAASVCVQGRIGWGSQHTLLGAIGAQHTTLAISLLLLLVPELNTIALNAEIEERHPTHIDCGTCVRTVLCATVLELEVGPPNLILMCTFLSTQVRYESVQ